MADPVQDFQYVHLPDGSYGKFRADTPDDLIRSAITKDFPDAYKPAQPKGFVGQLMDRATSDAKDVANAPGIIGKATTALNKAADAYSDSEIGSYKGLGGTAYGLANLANKGLRFLAQHQPGPGPTPDQVDKVIPAMNPELPTFLKPSNPIQSIGKGAEQIAEFFIPSGAVAKGGKAIDAAAQVSKLPTFLKMASKVGGKAALEGGANAAVAEAQGGDAAPAFFLGAGGKVAGEAAGAAGKAIVQKGKQAAPGIINSLIKPLEKEYRFTKNPGAGVVDEGITANTQKGLLDQISAKKQELGSAIDAKLSHPTVASKVINARPLIEGPINRAIADAAESGEQALVKRLVDIKNGLMKTQQIADESGNLVATGNKNLNLSPLDTAKLKRKIGSDTKWTGQAFDNDVNKVRVAIYRNLNNAIDGAVPGTKKLNSRYGNILGAEKSLERTSNIGQRHAPINLADIGMAMAGTGTALAAGEKNILPTLAATVAAPVARRAMNSAAVITRTAKAANNLDKVPSPAHPLNFLKNAYLANRPKSGR